MTRRLLPILVTLLGFALLYLGHTEGALLAGGGPCVIIINEGNVAYGAIEGAESEGGSIVSGMGKAIARLKAAITASCALVSYGSLYMAIEESELAGPVLQKIIDFHVRATKHFRGEATMTAAGYDVAAEAERLEKYNRRLANLIAEENAYPE